MKIALISFHSFAEPGGVKSHILGLAKYYQKKGIDFKIIIPRRKIGENYGEKVILLGTAFKINFGGGISDLVFNFLPGSIERILMREKFDILHFHNASFPSFFQILLSPLSFETTNLLTFHSDIERSNFLKKYSRFFDFFISFCNLRLDGIIAVSQIAFRYLKEFKKQKTVIPNGIDLETFNPNNPKLKEFLDGKINLLFVGRIEERKGLIYLLMAFKILSKKFQNLRLIVAGDGPEREKCENFVRENRLREVIFLGHVEENLPSLYVSSHIFCAPSIYGESFGIVILEAMASGLPVVGFANQGYKTLFKGKLGEKFLVRPKDYKQLAQKLEVLIKNEKLRKEIGKWGLEEVKKYSLEKVGEKVLQFYETCKNAKKAFKKVSIF